MILDMGDDNKDTPLILGRPFLNTTNTCIYVGSGQLQLHFAGKKEIFAFSTSKPFSTDKKLVKKNRPRRKTTERNLNQQGKWRSVLRSNKSPRRHGVRRKILSSVFSFPKPEKTSVMEQGELALEEEKP